MRPPLALLVLVSMAAPAAMNMFLPSMPGMVRALETDAASVQLALSLFIAGLAVGQLIYGPLSDRFGRRPTMLAGMALFAVASVMAALAPSIEVLVPARVAQALGGCAGMVLTRAIVRDVFARDQAASALGYITMGMAVAPMISPIIGGQLDLWLGWRAGFVVIAVFGAAVFLAALRWLPETHRGEMRPPRVWAFVEGYGRLIRSWLFLANMAAFALTGVGFFAFVGAAPYLVVEVIGGSPRDYGLWFMLMPIGYMTGSFVTGRLASRLGTERMLLAGLLITLGAALVFAAVLVVVPFGLAALFAPMLLVTLGTGIAMPNAIVGGVSVHPDLAGTGSGLIGFAQLALGGAATMLVVRLADGTPWPLVGMIVVCSSLALACAVPVWLARAR